MLINDHCLLLVSKRFSKTDRKPTKFWIPKKKYYHYFYFFFSFYSFISFVYLKRYWKIFWTSCICKFTLPDFDFKDLCKLKKHIIFLFLYHLYKIIVYYLGNSNEISYILLWLFVKKLACNFLFANIITLRLFLFYPVIAVEKSTV